MSVFKALRRAVAEAICDSVNKNPNTPGVSLGGLADGARLGAARFDVFINCSTAKTRRRMMPEYDLSVPGPNGLKSKLRSLKNNSTT